MKFLPLTELENSPVHHWGWGENVKQTNLGPVRPLLDPQGPLKVRGQGGRTLKEAEGFALQDT